VDLVPVAVALDRMLAGLEPLPADTVVLSRAAGRVLASPAIARRSQPSFAASAMDGYALRSGDSPMDARLRVIGTAAAGHRFAGVVGVGEAVRIFTGAPLPAGADAVLVQESAARDGPDVLVQGEPRPGHNVRPAGLDFAAGDELLRPGTRLGPRELALAAAGNCGEVLVHRSPRVAVLSIGDELVPAGAEPGPDQTIASNALAIAGLAAGEGAVVEDLGIARDEPDVVAALAADVAGRADVLVTIGGASVGDHDITREALARAGMALDFWRVAMRPGRPLAFGRLGPLRVLGFPGNPVSSFVCGLVFLRPLLRGLAGRPLEVRTEPAVLGTDLPANGPWIAYLRARLERGTAGLPVVRPLPDQDSSLLRVLAEADALLIRPASAPAAAAGSPCVVLPLP
jgi:molybdopterin molybdotransferase